MLGVAAAAMSSGWNGSGLSKHMGIGVIGVLLSEAKQYMGGMYDKLMAKECDLCHECQGAPDP
eukprot:4048069-Pyramimonas_sp.AAC.1